MEIENIIIKEGIIYENKQVEVNLSQLETQYTEMQASIDEQQVRANDLLSKINYIKSIQKK